MAKLSASHLRRCGVVSIRKTWPTDSLLDVGGLRVGHFAKSSAQWRSGTTVVLLPEGTRGGVDVRGGAPGTRETELLRPENMMDRVDAICLSGGSAYGLSAADGVMRYLESVGTGFPVGKSDRWVVPIVPAAVIFDLGRAGRFSHRPNAEFGWNAARTARPSASVQGAIGAGVGARSGGLQGGIGSASQVIDGMTVAALAVVNSVGTVIDPSTALPWFTEGLSLSVPSAQDKRVFRRHFESSIRPLLSSADSLNTTIGLVATDVDLTKAECQKMAGVAHDGLARAIRPAHSMNDGDTIFAVSTRHRSLIDQSGAIDRGSFVDTSARAARFNRILEAAANVFARACTLAVVRAETQGEQPAYRDLVPSAFAGY
jgi:L-aminopeptidase/D-esterase-like protein